MRVIDLFERERNAAIVDETTGVKIWRNDRPNTQNPCQLMLFRPRATKPFANYVFPTSEQRAAYIEKQLESARMHNEFKAAQKVERKVREEKEASDPNPKRKPLKRIAKEVREQLKAEFPGCKWSVRTEHYSMGQALNIELSQADVRVFRTPEEIRSDAIHGEEQWQTNARDNLVLNAQRRYTQLSGTTHVDDSKLLTEEAKKIINRAIDIINKDNWDHSDVMTDYYDVNYAVRFDIGDFGKPLVEPVVEVEHPEDIARRAAIRERQQKEKENARRISAANREKEQKLRESVAAGQADVHTPNPLERV